MGDRDLEGADWGERISVEIIDGIPSPHPTPLKKDYEERGFICRVNIRFL